jgi:ribonuclease P protein component
LIEARQRRSIEALAPVPCGPRFGFAVTKKLGNAVTRNRIRRRLKAALSELAPSLAQPGYDYVVVARSAAFDRSFAEIRSDLTRAFAILHREASRKGSTEAKNQPRKPLA